MNTVYRTMKAKGFTILELMMGVAVLGIVTALAVPSFADFIERQRIKSDAQRLTKTLQNARIQAMTTQAARSSVCWNDTASDITFAYTNLDGDAKNVDLKPREIAVFEGEVGSLGQLLSVNTLVVEETEVLTNENDGCIGFNAQGGLTESAGANVNFAICREEGNTDNAFIVSVNRGGRVVSTESEVSSDCGTSS